MGRTKLSHSQHVALDCLISGASIKETAEKAGVNRHTVHTWMKNAEFSSRLHSRQRDRARTVRERMRAYTMGAADLLNEAVNDEKANMGTRVKAATALLDRAGVNPGAMTLDSPKPDTDEQRAIPSLASDEGREALANSLASIPPSILEKALVKIRERNE